MDIKRLGLFAAALGGLLAHTHPLPAQSWIPTAAPSQGWTAIASSADGKKLAAAAHNGRIYVSSDGGSRWTAASVPHQPWTSIASSADGTRLVAAANPGMICVSKNSGAAWEAVPASSNAWFSTASSSDGGSLIAAADRSGIFRSENSGASWTAALALTNHEWSCAACSADGSTLVVAADPGPIYTSTDAGATWTPSSLPTLSWTSVASSADGAKLAAAAALDGIYISTDSGATWTKSSAPADAWSGVACAADGAKLAAAAFNGGIYISANTGQTWIRTDAEPMAWSSISCSANGSNLVATVFGGGIYVPGTSGAKPGNYQGLFYDTNNLAPESSGFFSASVGNKGILSAKLQLAGKSYSFSGQFTADGSISNAISRSKLPPLTVLLQSVASGNALAGFIGNGTWTAQLAANRAVYSTTNSPAQAGNKYTLAMEGNDGLLEFGSDPAKPCITGFGTVAVDASGNLSFGGSLGDGTAVAQKSFVSKQGWWPFYVSQHAGGGVAFGWLAFTNGAHKDIDGFVTWFRPSWPAAKLYPAGFTSQTEVTGSLFQPAFGVPMLNFTTGQVCLVNGNLPSLTNHVVLSTNNVLTGTNKLSLRISASSGAFKGGMRNPETGKSIGLNGVVLQKLNAGIGAFLGTNQTGGMLLVPAQ